MKLNKTLMFLVTLWASHSMAAQQLDKNAAQNPHKNRGTIAEAARAVFNALVLQGKIMPINHEIKVDQSVLDRAMGKKEEIEANFSSHQISYDESWEQYGKMVSDFPAQPLEKTDSSPEQLHLSINMLANNVLVLYLKNKYPNEFKNKNMVFNLEAKNKDGNTAYTIVNVEARVTPPENDSFSGNAPKYGDYSGNPNSFSLTQLWANKSTGQTSFHLKAEFCGITLACAYTSSWRFYQSDANGLLFNMGRVAPQDITITESEDDIYKAEFAKANLHFKDYCGGLCQQPEKEDVIRHLMLKMQPLSEDRAKHLCDAILG